jgi:hypothetical protein
MAEAEIDQVAAVKVTLEMMIKENNDVHEYFTDLLEKVAELEALDPPERRSKFRNLVDMGAFKFNNVDIRHFTQTQPQKALPPPVFISRTKRRLKNTSKVVHEFESRGVFEGAPVLLQELDLLASNIINESDNAEVRGFKENVEVLRESELFKSYMSIKKEFISKDPDFKTDSEFLAAKESVEEGEEILRQRGEELTEINDKMESGEAKIDEVQNVLDKMSFDKT